MELNWLLEAVLISAAQLAGLIVVVWLGYCALLCIVHSTIGFFKCLASASNRSIGCLDRGVDLLTKDIGPVKEWIEVVFFGGKPRASPSPKDLE